MYIHITFCENQSTGSETERETNTEHVSLLSTLRRESRLIKNGGIARTRKKRTM
jgi:hypothetical protein